MGKTKVKRLSPPDRPSSSQRRNRKVSAEKPNFTNISKAKNPTNLTLTPIQDNWLTFDFIHDLVYCPTVDPDSDTAFPVPVEEQVGFSCCELIVDLWGCLRNAFKSTTERIGNTFQGTLQAIKSKRKSRKRRSMKDIILALIARVMFGAHGLIAIWRAYTEYETITMWLLLVPVGLLILEGLFTVGARGGEEYKWISPCVLLYLASVVPSVWFLELKNFDRRQGYHICNDLHWGITTRPGCRKEFQYAVLTADVEYVLRNVTLRKEACEEEFRGYKSTPVNETIITLTTTTLAPVATTGINVAPGLDNVIGTLDQGKKALDNLLQNINFFNEQTWILVLHQLLLFFLIVGRWLLPTGEGISRDQLSQLLLVFIGVGADILEFVTETVKEIEVRCDRQLLIVIMAFWSWSALQFSLVLTASKARRTRAVGIYEGEDENESPVVVVEEEEPGRCMKFWKNMEVWGILSTLILQDGPFLATRLYIMVGRGVVHQMIVFFTTKNALVVILQLYRLSIIGFHKPKEEDDDGDEFGISALGALQGTVISGINPKQFEKSESQGNGSTVELPGSSPGGAEKPAAIKTVDETVSNASANNNKGKREVAFAKVR